MTPRIREATLDDVPRIATLAGVLGYRVDGDEMSSRLRQVLERPDELVLAADNGSDELAGWTHAVIHTLLTSPLTCELQALVVSPAPSPRRHRTRPGRHRRGLVAPARRHQDNRAQQHRSNRVARLLSGPRLRAHEDAARLQQGPRYNRLTG
jgi:hypothetical protein